VTFTRTRLSLVEYGAPVDLSRAISDVAGIERAKANSLLMEAGSRVASSLRLSYSPINIEPSGVRAVDFAGLIRLGPSLELEVAPKFLGLDEKDSTWREDFFFLSTLSRHGRLLASERLSASGGAPRDLSTLVARAIASMYEQRKRRPLRSYRRVREADFFIDGDPEPMDLLFPSPDGFEQDTVRFDRRNCWNADIVGAARELLPEVSDPSAVSSLVRLIEELSPQGSAIKRGKAIPARHRAWRPLHELSVDVLGGLGLSYQQGRAHAPGYLVSTWRVWEDLLTISARLAFGRDAVVPQRGYPLGTKVRGATGSISKLSVYPDCVIESDGDRPKVLLDAKYKGHVEKGNLRISEADIYEALAFSRATGCDMVVLAYPAPPERPFNALGHCFIFEKVTVGSVQISGIQIECRRIASVGGLREFAANMKTGISSAFL